MLQIITFGGCTVRRSDGSEVAIPRRRMALLLAVELSGSRGVSREKLLALLWPELDDERGRAALSQALYALRKDLGSEDAISGTADLRADPAQVTSDRARFLAAIDRGADDEAVLLYRGPYLDGFFVREAPEFEGAIEQERQALASRHAAALERLARTVGTEDPAAGVRLWRQRANLDPTDAAVAVELMRAMAAAGDRAGALRHAEVYAELLRNSADLPPDPSVLACAAEIRQGSLSEVATPSRDRSLAPPPAQAVADHTAARPASPAPRPQARSTGLLVLGAVGALLLAARFLPISWLRATPTQRVVAVTEFQDFAGDSLTGPLAELLRTSLANIPGLSVVSAERMADGRAHDPRVGALGAAVAAGATEALNGALYRRPDGVLRFDLRRVDPADGRVLEAFELDGRDVFTLTTEATRRLVERYGVRQLDGEVTAVSSSSLTAIRLYQAGHDAAYRGDGRAAYNLFVDATKEDTAFAMAEFYAGFTAPNDEERTARFDRAHRLGLTASLREHLIIDVNRADFHSMPGTRALAESLVTLFPREMSGHFALGRTRLYQEGDFLGAARAYREALRYDSVGFIAIGRRCDACVLYSGLFFTWMFADSFPAARATAVEWTKNLPGDPAGWKYRALAAVLTGDTLEWARSRARAAALVPEEDQFTAPFYAAFYLGDLQRADSLLQAWIAATPPAERADLHWIEAQLRREQGRPRAAVAAMAKWRSYTHGRLPYEAVFQAGILFDAGEYRRAVALYDSLGHLGSPVPSRAARGWVWAHALMASPLVALGDTAALLPIADTMHQQAAGSGFIRDRRLEHHLQGLYYAARGDDRRALAEFREAIWSYTAGYTRTDLEMGRTRLRLGQPRDAAQVCGSGLRAEMSASAQYASRAEFHECVARAWAAAGVKDSARAHLTTLLRQWNDPEPAWRPRRDSAAALLASLAP
ncbi:MAG TPA: BTAD domain-containing putative transcriptional regulator [Gemmatimonadales bacterium]|nr:BTAD domain-containing putative transcriptional regulator [Gemmatimonadales bacterium]